MTSSLFLALAAVLSVTAASTDKHKTTIHRSLRANTVNDASAEVANSGPYAFLENTTAEHPRTAAKRASLDNADSGYEEFMKSQKPLSGVALLARLERVTKAVATKLRLDHMVEEDVKLIFNTFLPSPRPSIALLWGTSSGSAILVILWFMLYLYCIYENDRDETLDRWKHVERIPRKEHELMRLVKPDIVLVFHHPLHPFSDKDDQISSQTLQKCIVHEKRDEMTSFDSVAPRINSILKTPSSSHFDRVTSRVKDFFHRYMQGANDADEEEAATSTLSLGKVREALLQDVYSKFPAAGFSLISFSSIDGKEIFVGVSIENPDVEKEILNSGKFRLQLRHSVVTDMLQIGQDAHEPESSPPFVFYDSALAKQIGGSECNDRQFYQTFQAHTASKSIILGKDKIQMVRKHMESYLDLESLVHFGILKDFYCVHNPYYITELDAIWSSFWMMKDFTFVQPMTLIYRYFGARVAFRFMFNGLYCKMLTALMPVALLLEVVHHVEEIVSFKFGATFLTFSTILVIWSRMACNLFERERLYFMDLWDVRGDARRRRPNFFGAKVKSALDSREWSFEYPENKRVLRKVAVYSICLVLCSFVQVGVYIWINVFEGHMDFVASGFLAMMVGLIQVCYRPLVNYLTKMENHKYDADFVRSYSFKLFVFLFVNQFSVYFYIAIKMRHTEKGCPNQDCIGLLRYQLCSVFAIICAGNLGLALVDYIRVKLLLWWQLKTVKNNVENAPPRSFLEEQSKYVEYDYMLQAEETAQLFVPLGYVLIFGAVAPRIVPLCLLKFVFHLRTEAFLTTRSWRRPFPSVIYGLGVWADILQILMYIGMVFSGYLWVAYGALFEEAWILTRLSSFIMYMFCMQAVWWATDLLCPPTSKGGQLLKARRDYVLDKLYGRVRDENSKNNDSKYPVQEAVHSNEILTGAWDNIDPLVDVASDFLNMKSMSSYQGVV
mmetsp:Transcript_65405/g.114335  ORF Transcript_65405/g.114335 Transcript_65405/m.114335 type:complete len:951 (-) Transcript_65405:275-3127(-)